MRQSSKSIFSLSRCHGGLVFSDMYGQADMVSDITDIRDETIK